MARKESNGIPARLAYRTRRWVASLLLGGLLPTSAAALTQPTLAALENPVAPGTTLTYQITLTDITPPAPPPPTCFDPPAECVEIPVTCSNPAPSCVSGICENAANDGTSCLS